MEERKVLLSLEEMIKQKPDITEEQKVKNWNDTVRSIERNFEDGSHSAWSNTAHIAAKGGKTLCGIPMLSLNHCKQLIKKLITKNFNQHDNRNKI